MINQSNAGGLKGLSRTVLTAVIAFIVAIGIFATTAFAGLVSQYNVEIQIDNDSFVVTTNETEPIEILSQANITLADSDKLDISAFTGSEGSVIRIDKLNNVNIEFDGVINSYSVYADTVGEALNELGISSDDKLKANYELTDSIKDGMVITLQSAKSVTLTVDNTSTKHAIYQGTVNDLLTLAGISLGADDYTQPSLNTELKDNMAVTVYRVEYKTVDRKENISFKTRTQNDSSMDSGTEKILIKGVNGVDEVSYKVKYVNGKEDSKTELSRKTVKEPVNQVVNVGTKAKSTGVSDNITLQYSERYNVSSNPLTAFKGVVYYNGHRETYYSQKVLPGNGLNIPGRHVADDGTIRDGDGYICVAANSAYMKKGTTLMTSLGPAKVYDCGCAYGTIDIYVNW
ncbi:MAG: G5 domain-containing protein [Eubacterium sp.]|nr:G5 domain-containing protein [Eubacterium sp.]